MGTIFQKACTIAILREAWKRVGAKKAAGGLDGVTVQEFGADLERNLERLRQELSSGSYTPEPLDRIDAPKFDGSGETRPLSLPAVRDKVVQQAVKLVIEPLFNPLFLDCSYAYRPGKGPRKAFARVNHLLTAEHRRWVALGDFDRFFDNLDHEFLIRQVVKVVDEPEIVRLIRMWMKIGFVNRRGDYFDMEGGVGQGSVISPLLSNTYAHPLDEYMTRKGCSYVRYSDNLIVLENTRERAMRAFEDLKAFSEEVLKLRLNDNPRPVRSLEDGFVFLGIYYHGDARAISTKKMGKIRAKLKAVLRRGSPPDVLMEKITKSIEGIDRYYEVIRPEAQFIEIDQAVVQGLSHAVAGFVRDGHYRSAGEILLYLTPLPFLSDAFNRQKEERLREIAALALKQIVTTREKAEKAQRPKPDVKEAVQSADQAVTRRKHKHLKARAISSEVFVSTHGAFLGKTEGRLVVRCKGKVLLTERFDKLKNVVVAANGVTLSSDLIRECSSRQIGIHFAEAHGPPYAMVHLPAYPHAHVATAQVAALQNGKGLETAKCIVIGKIRNQLNLMKFYGRSRKDEPEFTGGVDVMETEVERLAEEAKGMAAEDGYDKAREKLMSVEGRAASTYWALVKMVLGNDVDFPGRRRKGADDLINCLLNYGYGILYPRIWRAVMLAGLNPYVSFLHAPRDDKPTLVFDMIEEFRCQAVDRAVFTMVTRGERLSLEKSGGLLSEETKRKLAQNVLERLASFVPYRKRKIQLDEVIRLHFSAQWE